jgi:hypothetical protein
MKKMEIAYKYYTVHIYYTTKYNFFNNNISLIRIVIAIYNTVYILKLKDTYNDLQ